MGISLVRHGSSSPPATATAAARSSQKTLKSKLKHSHNNNSTTTTTTNTSTSNSRRSDRDKGGDKDDVTDTGNADKKIGTISKIGHITAPFFSRLRRPIQRVNIWGRLPSPSPAPTSPSILGGQEWAL